MHKLKAKTPLVFKSRVNLPEITALKAGNLKELLEGIMMAEPGVIFNHTHNFYHARQLLALELTNDFAYWTKNVLLEEELAEKLAAINILECPNLEQVRTRHVAVLNTYMGKRNIFPDVPQGQEFYFTRSDTLIFDAGISARTLQEFYNGLKLCNLNSIFYHMLEYRIRLENPDNEFSAWLRQHLGCNELAALITNINPYNFPLQGLKNFLLEITDDFIKS